MSTKELKPAFSAIAGNIDSEPEQDAPDPVGESGLYPRSLHIIDFVLTELFAAGYVVPHTDKRFHENDCLDPVSPEERDITKEVTSALIDRAYVLPDTENLFYFTFTGVDDWGPFEARLSVKNTGNRTIALRNAHPALQDAYKEFMEDLALATANVDGVRIDSRKGIIKANNPLSLFRVVRDLILWRNNDCDLDDTMLMATKRGYPLPMEFRRIDLPDMALDAHVKSNDGDLDRHGKAEEGAEFLDGENTGETALHNIPPRPYNSRQDLFLAAWEMKDRIMARDPMVRLDEMEAIVLQETCRHTTYAANPLLNLH